MKIDILNISCSAGCEVIARVTLSLGSLGVGNLFGKFIGKFFGINYLDSFIFSFHYQ